jgi:hypothetical protein
VPLGVPLALILAVSTPAQAARVPLPDGVTVTVAPCPGYPDALGCAVAATATVYVRSAKDRETRAHELGHLWDAQVLTDDDRAWFSKRLGRPRLPWTRSPGQTSNGELFAEAYARCAVPLKRGRGEESVYGYNLDGQRHRQICAAIQVLGMVRRSN